MWIVCGGGFISVVEYDPSKTRNKKSKHATVAKDLENYVAADEKTLSTHLMVRARVRDDLKFLEEAGEHLEEKVEVYEDLRADYQWRCVVSRDLLKHAMAAQIDGIDYWSHVKESMAKKMPPLPEGSSATSRYSALSGFWSGHASWQANPVYGGWGYGNNSKKDGERIVSTSSGKKYIKKNGKWQKYVEPAKPKNAWGTSSYYGGGYDSYVGGAPKGGSNAKGGQYISGQTNPETGKYEPGYWLNADGSKETLAEHYSTGSATKSITGQTTLWESESSGTVGEVNLDDPALTMADWEIEVASGNLSRETMLAQVKDLIAWGDLGEADVDDVVDRLEAEYGTCDLDDINLTKVREFIKASNDAQNGTTDE